MDWMGKWIFGFWRNVGYPSSLEAELWGMRDGFKLSLDLNLTGIEVETDTTIMKNLILGNSNNCHQLSNLIHECRYLLDPLGTLTISHTYHEGNKCLDLLANEGFNHKGLLIFSSIPNCISFQVFEDTGEDSDLDAEKKSGDPTGKVVKVIDSLINLIIFFCCNDLNNS
ncbi:uncharacterized protein LOC114320074 [Camellia sinensis]|uniref:uncharacterized protein LOC114320074 n=1 Tax=Camellia sinensis TaxID=4442 RepID=UPI001036A2AB|nr:uncharacterized protein LOC114320074 [Camellia sinensis]